MGGWRAFTAAVGVGLSHDDAAEAVAALDEVWSAARQAWPEFNDVAVDTFAAAIGNGIAGTSPAGWADGIRSAQAADLYLAAAAAAGDQSALREVDTQLAAAAGQVARRMGTDVDEAVQLIRVHLLAPTDGSPPRILKYSGRGRLKAWFRVVSARQLLNQNRKVREQGTFVDPVVLSTPELAAMRQQYQDVFASALRTAFEGLDDKYRSVLRASVLDGLGTAAIGKQQGVHTATAARWLLAARERLVHGFRSELGSKLADATEVDQLLGMLQSRLQWTEGTLLGSSGE